MRFITLCPNCETEFFVNDEQLGKHGGKVRCGHCLHVFDAKSYEVDSSNELESEYEPSEPEVKSTDIQDNSESLTDNDSIVEKNNNDTAADLIVFEDEYLPQKILSKKRKSKKIATWLLILLAILLLLAAIGQSIYFLRTEIATYYPITKPYLVKACKPLKCTVDLPKKIELIAIDDSDIQEDADYKNLMRFSSTLINQAGFNQAFPNLELTLTDIDDKPQLRRIFKPSEYLPNGVEASEGLNPGQEIKIKLAISAGDNVVAGYRVFVTY